MPLDQRTLAPAGPRGQAEPPDIVGFDGGAPDTVFGDTIDGGTPSGTGPVIDGDEGNP